MKYIRTAIITAATLAFAVSAAQDLTDYVLECYKLSAAEEAMYSEDDGRISHFWQKWDKCPSTLDYIEMKPSTHGDAKCSGYFEGEQDAQLIVKAAYGTNGLYMLLNAVDDQFVDLLAGDQTTAEWQNDAVDMYYDIYPSDQLTYVTDHNQLTATNVQIQWRFGGQTPSDVIRYNIYDETSTAGDKRKIQELSQSEMRALGFKFEIVQENYSNRYQEWFMPWDRVADGMSMPSEGQKSALIMGYNDVDADAGCLDWLRWKNNGDAYNSPSMDNWGDIQYMGSLDAICDVDISANPRLNNMTVGNGAVARTEYFTLDGRKITTSLNSVPSNMIVIERLIDARGNTISSSTLYRQAD